MKISTKGRYALRMMLEFALNDTNEYTKINQVSKNQQISEKYLEQIVTILSRSGFVKSSRGAQGGYRLTKNPSEYTVGMILRLTEGSLAPVTCLEDSSNQCPRNHTCVTLKVWEQVNSAVNDVVDHITLQDLVDDHKSLNPNESPT